MRLEKITKVINSRQEEYEIKSVLSKAKCNRKLKIIFLGFLPNQLEGFRSVNFNSLNKLHMHQNKFSAISIQYKV